MAEPHVVDQLIVQCTHAYRLRETINDPIAIDTVLARIQPVLTDIFRNLARQVARQFNWAADDVHAGYVNRIVGSVELRVPYHLFDALPSSDTVLSDFIGFLDEVRMTSDSAMCLSGSCAMYGELQCVSDIDLCEYVPPGKHAQQLAESVHRIAAPGPHRAVCLRMSVSAEG